MKQAIESIQAQTFQTDDFVLVCDGPLNDGLDAIIAEKQQEMGETLNVVRLAKNGGLGNALMIIPNLIALLGLRKVVISETKKFFDREERTKVNVRKSVVE